MCHRVRHAAKAVKAPAVLARGAEAALADRIVSGIGYYVLDLLHAMHVRNDKTLCTDIEKLEYRRAAYLTHTAQRRYACVFRGSYEPRAGFGLNWGVLIVDDNKVYSGAPGAFHEIFACGIEKYADRLLAVFELLL